MNPNRSVYTPALVVALLAGVAGFGAAQHARQVLPPEERAAWLVRNARADQAEQLFWSLLQEERPSVGRVVGAWAQ